MQRTHPTKTLWGRMPFCGRLSDPCEPVFIRGQYAKLSDQLRLYRPRDARPFLAPKKESTND